MEVGRGEKRTGGGEKEEVSQRRGEVEEGREERGSEGTQRALRWEGWKGTKKSCAFRQEHRPREMQWLVCRHTAQEGGQDQREELFPDFKGGHESKGHRGGARGMCLTRFLVMHSSRCHLACLPASILWPQRR